VSSCYKSAYLGDEKLDGLLEVPDKGGVVFVYPGP
jgi:hypothetical protein